LLTYSAARRGEARQDGPRRGGSESKSAGKGGRVEEERRGERLSNSNHRF